MPHDEESCPAESSFPPWPRKVLSVRLHITLGLIVFVGPFLACQARADGFVIDLEVKAAKVRKTAHEEMANASRKPSARIALNAKAGDSIMVHWKMSHPGPNDTAKDVLVHFFVVRETQAGQQAVPKLDKGVIVESALTMDFKPRDKTEGDMVFAIPKWGCYLIRLETVGAAHGIDEHEQFAALDLVVQ
jgi:hypothetical protein